MALNVFPFHVSTLNYQEILRYLGHKGTSIPESLQTLIETCIHEMLETIRPVAVAAPYSITKLEDKIIVEDANLILIGNSIQRHLAPAKSVFLIALTTGQAVDRLIRTAMLNEPERGIILDSCASAAVEAATDQMQEIIRSDAAQTGQFLTSRFSPGYGDLPIELQKEFLRTLDAPRKIGLMTTGASHLAPSKSVTAIIGVTPQPTNLQYNPCDACKLRINCTLRKAGKTCWK